MESGKVFDTAVLSGQAACKLEQASHFLIVFFSMLDLHTAVLGSADQEVTALQANLL